MSTPIKPPGGSPEGGPESAEAPDESGSDVGELRDMVSESGASERAVSDGVVSESAAASANTPIDALRADVASGRLDADQAMERLVHRALPSAPGLDESQRAALEAQLREALAEDPSLIALRKDLQRASPSKP